MIAVLDSGSGGANVILECMKLYNNNFLYFVDNKNCPYGNKPASQVKQIILNNIDYLCKNYTIDFIILGCNTAGSVLEFSDLEKIKYPVLKTYPNLKSLTKQSGPLLLFATKNTIKNSNYVHYYLLNYPSLKTMYVKDLPKLVDEKIETKNAKINKKITKLIKKMIFFSKFSKKSLKNVKNVALGCTHFKHIKNNINEAFNCSLNFYYCEQEVAKLSKILINNQPSKSSVKVLLSEPNKNLQSAIERMFNE